MNMNMNTNSHLDHRKLPAYTTANSHQTNGKYGRTCFCTIFQLKSEIVIWLMIDMVCWLWPECLPSDRSYIYVLGVENMAWSTHAFFGHDALFLGVRRWFVCLYHLCSFKLCLVVTCMPSLYFSCQVELANFCIWWPYKYAWRCRIRDAILGSCLFDIWQK